MNTAIEHISEAELQREVIALCKRFGLTVFHFSDVVRSTSRGWPDLAILGQHYTIFRELKSSTGRRSLSQIRTGQLLTAAGFNWSVWRPADLEGGRIEAELRYTRDWAD